MRKLILIITILLLGKVCYSQTNFTYIYDAAGNRIKRELKTVLMSVAMPVNDTIETALFDNEQGEANAFEDNTGDAFPTILYPNPTYGQFTLDLPDFKPGERGYIMLYDQMGKIIVHQKYVSASQYFDISNVLPGFYVAHIMVNDKLVIKKIIKN
ncbi:MAG: T9SS type A sorting domain-containing protein [Prevotellaceae bacterium]|jgi:hypothetical protein|nr:T9SS type A sorting domain-containing protein [Prevotellaceae bacterium]